MSKKSLSCALSGIACAARKGRNLRIMFACAALVVLISFLLRLSGTEWAIVLMCCGGVIALEMVNTALEYIVDLVSPAYHDLAKKAKDVSAGAVLIGCLFAAAIGLVIFVPHIAALLNKYIPSR